MKAINFVRRRKQPQKHEILKVAKIDSNKTLTVSTSLKQRVQRVHQNQVKPESM